MANKNVWRLNARKSGPHFSPLHQPLNTIPKYQEIPINEETKRTEEVQRKINVYLIS